MTHPDSDGINEIVEGAHRAIGTGLARWTEMLAWRGRDHAYDRADVANRGAQQALAERDLAAGEQSLAAAVGRRDGDRRMPIPDPDHGRGTPTDERSAPTAATVSVAEDAATAQVLVDYPARAELHARTHAELDGRAFFDDSDVDAVLGVWAQDRAAAAGQPGPGSPHWRQWALLEATDEQIDRAYTAVAGQPETARLAAAYHRLQDQLEQAATADAAWRTAADRRAAQEIARLHAAPASPASNATRADRRSRILAAGFGVDLTQSLLLHDLTFGAPAAAARTARTARRTAATRGARAAANRGRRPQGLSR